MINKVEEGWLRRSLDEARRTIIRKMKPMDVVREGTSVTLPISEPEAKDLYEDLNEHFYAWTGRTLEQYVRDRQNG